MRPRAPHFYLTKSFIVGKIILNYFTLVFVRLWHSSMFPNCFHFMKYSCRRRKWNEGKSLERWQQAIHRHSAEITQRMKPSPSLCAKLRQWKIIYVNVCDEGGWCEVLKSDEMNPNAKEDLKIWMSNVVNFFNFTSQTSQQVAPRLWLQNFASSRV